MWGDADIWLKKPKKTNKPVLKLKHHPVQEGQTNSSRQNNRQEAANILTSTTKIFWESSRNWTLRWSILRWVAQQPARMMFSAIWREGGRLPIHTEFYSWLDKNRSLECRFFAKEQKTKREDGGDTTTITKPEKVFFCSCLFPRSPLFHIPPCTEAKIFSPEQRNKDCVVCEPDPGFLQSWSALLHRSSRWKDKQWHGTGMTFSLFLNLRIVGSEFVGFLHLHCL